MVQQPWSEGYAPDSRYLENIIPQERPVATQQVDVIIECPKCHGLLTVQLEIGMKEREPQPATCKPSATPSTPR